MSIHPTFNFRKKFIIFSSLILPWVAGCATLSVCWLKWAAGGYFWKRPGLLCGPGKKKLIQTPNLFFSIFPEFLNRWQFNRIALMTQSVLYFISFIILSFQILPMVEHLILCLVFIIQKFYQLAFYYLTFLHTIPTFKEF